MVWAALFFQPALFAETESNLTHDCSRDPAELAFKVEFPVLLRCIKSPDPYIREIVIQALRVQWRKSPEKTVEVLIVALKDKKSTVRWNAALALATMKSAASPAVPTLLEILRDENETVRHHAFEALAAIGPAAEEAVPALFGIMMNKQETLDSRARARTALEGIGISKTDERMVLFQTEHANFQKTQRESIQDLTGFVPNAVLIEALESPLPFRRRFAVHCLGLSNEWKPEEHNYKRPSPLPEVSQEMQQVVTAVSNMLNDSDEEVRNNAVFALGMIGPNARTAVSQLLQQWKNGRIPLPVATLGSIGPVHPDIVPILLSALKDEDPEVREAAVYALGDIGSDVPEVIVPLVQISKSEDEDLSYAAQSVISAWGPEGARAIDRASKNSNALTCSDVLGVAGPLTEGSLSAVIRDLKDPNPEVFVEAASSLAEENALWDRSQRRIAEGVLESEAKEIAHLLARRMKEDQDEKVRMAALGPLMYMGPLAQEALPQFLERLKDLAQKEDESSRMLAGYVGQAIAGIGPAAIPAVTEELNRSEGWLRDALLEALRFIQDEQRAEGREKVRLSFDETWKQITALVRRFQDPNTNVSKEAARLLEEKWTDRVMVDSGGAVFFRYELQAESGQTVLVDISYNWKGEGELLSSLVSLTERQDGDYVLTLPSGQKCSVKIMGRIENGELNAVVVERSCSSSEDDEQEAPLIKVKSKRGHEIFFDFSGLGTAIHPAWDPYYSS